jgi:Family of unknown function (DUF6751)
VALLRTNADVTLYMKYRNAATIPPSESYHSIQVKGVAWENRKASNTLRVAGRIKADQALIFIPKVRDADYLEPRAWQALVSKGSAWTLQLGDVIVRGLVSDTLSSMFTITDLKRKYNDVLEISSVDLMDNGSRALQHWKVSAG